MRALIKRIVLFAVMIPIGAAFAEPGTAPSNYEKTTVAYRQVGDRKILADVYRPPGTKVLPVIVYIHGGALIVGSRDLDSAEERAHPETRFDLLRFAQREQIAVVSIDYRLAPETKLPDIVSDVETAFRWLRSRGAAQFRLDADRVVVLGCSAGGYLTLVTGYRVRPRPRALVSLYGYGDLTGDWYSKPSAFHRHPTEQADATGELALVSPEQAASQSDGTVISDAHERKGNGILTYLYYRQNGLWPREVSGFPQATLAEKIAPYEPLRNVGPDFPPTLLIHGRRDRDVPYEQSELMAQQFKRRHVPYLLIPIDTADHQLIGGDARQIREAFQTLEAFIRRHLDLI